MAASLGGGGLAGARAGGGKKSRTSSASRLVVGSEQRAARVESDEKDGERAWRRASTSQITAAWPPRRAD
jgi:hypothetical protein